MNLAGTVKMNPVGVLVLLGLTFISFIYIFAGKPPTERKVSLKNLLITAIKAAESGGEEIKVLNEIGWNIRSKGKTREGANDPVTDADYRSHCVMYYGLHNTFPYVEVISEEDADENRCHSLHINLSEEEIVFDSNDEEINKIGDILVPAKDITIWIDPLDATQEFTERLHDYVTTMVCIVLKGYPIIGVIHEPYKKTTSWGWSGSGYALNLHYEKHSTNVEKPKIIISRSHSGDVKKFIKKSIPKAEILIAGGAGYKILQLISGNASAYVHRTKIKKWDLCAGNAILNSLHGRLSTLRNENVDYSDRNAIDVTDGVLATMNNHDWFYQKLKSR